MSEPWHVAPEGAATAPALAGGAAAAPRGAAAGRLAAAAAGRQRRGPCPVGLRAQGGAEAGAEGEVQGVLPGSRGDARRRIGASSGSFGGFPV